MPAVAALGIDPTHPLLTEAPLPNASCHLPISTISGLTVDSDGASFTLSNTSSFRSQDALTLTLGVSGQQRLFWVPVDLRPGMSVSVAVSFLTPVTSPVIGLCGDHPVGIVECPTPVATVAIAAN
jgi:hypothetical protein